MNLCLYTEIHRADLDLLLFQASVFVQHKLLAEKNGWIHQQGHDLSEQNSAVTLTPD